MEDNEIRILGYCAECGNEITDETEAYVDQDGQYFDDIECVLEYYKVYKVE